MSAILTSEQARQAYQGEVQKAQSLKATADKLRDDIAASEDGAAQLMDTKSELFEKLDAAYRAADEAADTAAALRDRLQRLEELDRRSGSSAASSQRKPYAGESGGQAGGKPKSFAHRLTSNEQFAEFQKRLGAALDGGGTAQAQQILQRGFDPVALMSRDEFRSFMDFMATTVTGSSATSGAPFIINDLMPGYVPYARKRPVLAAMVGQGETNSDTVEVVQQTSASTGAAETAETSQAPESAVAFTSVTFSVQDITHFVPITLRAMADAGQLRSVIENDLLGGVVDRLDTQIASGNGTPPNVTGIYNASSIGTQALGGDTRLDALHKAITQIRVAAGVLSEPDWIGVHPNDWQKVRLEKDTDGTYLMGPPGMSGDKQIWGIPVASSTVFTSGTPLVGDFANSARMWTREGMSLSAGYDGNDFTNRRISLLASMRVAFGVVRAGGFCTVTGF